MGVLRNKKRGGNETTIGGASKRGKEPKWSDGLWERLKELGLNERDIQDHKNGEVESRLLALQRRGQGKGKKEEEG